MTKSPPSSSQQRRQRLALVAQQPVRVVLEHEHLALRASSTSRRRRGSDIVTPAGFWKRRDRVDELRPAALALEPVERLLELVDAHAVLVHLDLHDVGLVARRSVGTAPG